MEKNEETIPKKKKKKFDYVNNKDLLEEIVKHQAEVKRCKDSNEPSPQIPNIIAIAIMRIADNLAKRPNFSGYTFIEDMKGDGVENCIRYIHNFDSTKSQNPFAYFTQIIWFAFLRRISKENKHAILKYDLIDSQIRKGTFDEWLKKQGVDGDDETERMSNYLKVSTEDIRNVITSKKKTKEKTSKKPKTKPTTTLVFE